MSLLKNISQWALEKGLIFTNQKIIIALSGGPDSIFLAHLLKGIQKEFNLSLIAAHLDHGWRAESAHEAEWVKSYCEKIEIPFIIGHAQKFQNVIKKNGSLEAEGRQARQLFFQEIAQKNSADSVALGHHANDQQETFFIRLLRGAQLSGLASMQPQRGIFIRPLLSTPKSVIIDYLKTHNIPFLNDPTNESDQFLRNRIRLHVLPTLQATDPRFDHHCLAAITALQEANLFIEQAAQQSLTAISNGSNIISLLELFKLDSFLQKKVIILWLINAQVGFTISESFVNEIMRFLSSPRGGKHILSTSWCIVKKSQVARIESFQTQNDQ